MKNENEKELEKKNLERIKRLRELSNNIKNNYLITNNDFLVENELKRYKDISDQIKDFLNLKTLKTQVDSIPQLNVISKQDIISRLKDSYVNDKLVFVLGAGISTSYGLPTWDILLQKLLVTTIEKEKSVSNALSILFTKLFSPSPLIAARYLQKFHENNNNSFEETVRKVLYSDFSITNTSPIMDEIVKFCVAAGKNPNLDSIITYNFDDLVEQHLDKTNVEIPYRPIYGVGMNPELGELPIYHVHGFLPQKGKLNKLNQITFGENVYHKQYSDIYSWNNIVQINKFRDFTCLFIGSSLTDPNIRRLLDIAKVQKGDKQEFHYIFKKKYKVEQVKKDLEILLKDNQILFKEKEKTKLNLNETVDFLVKSIETYEENDSMSFGVKTIWIEDYSEISDILKKIRIRNKK